MRKRLPLAAASIGALALALGATAASARAPFLIDQGGLGEVALGASQGDLVQRFGTPVRSLTEDGLERLVFAGRDIAVLFRTGSDRAVGVESASSRYTTATRVGPCSRASSLRAAYGARLQTVAVGPGVLAQRVGRITFTTTADGFIGTVLVGRQDVSPLVALRTAPCGRASL